MRAGAHFPAPHDDAIIALGALRECTGRTGRWGMSNDAEAPVAGIRPGYFYGKAALPICWNTT